MSEEHNGVPESTELEVLPSAGVDESPLTDEAVQEELGRLQQEVDNLREMYLRKLADFENYRKRQEREMEEFRRSANAGLIRDCLPVLDNLERALSAPCGDGDGLREGVQLVLRQFKDMLGRYGVVEIDPIGQAFDPTAHEAIAKRPTPGSEDSSVIEVLQKGYRLSDRLLRPALVVVAAGAAGDAGDATRGEGTGG